MKSTFEPIYSAARPGKFSVALRRLLGAEKMHIQSPYRGDLNHAWYVAGDIYYKSKDIFNALKSFKNSLRHCPEDWQAMMAIANCYSEMGKPRWAVFYLKKAVKLQRKNARLYYNLGNAFFDCLRYPEAIRSYEMAHKLRDSEINVINKKNLLLARKLNRKPT